MTSLLIDIGGTSIKAIVSQNGKYSDSYVELTNVKNPLKTLKKIIDQYELQEIKEILVAATGVINDCKVVSINGKIDNYLGIDLKTFIQNYTKVNKVYVINDVNAFSYSINDNESYFALMLGTGVGGAYVNQKKILLGAFGGSSEIGQIPYLNSTIDDYASTSGLVKIAQEQFNPKVKNGLDVFALDASLRQEILQIWSKHVAHVLALICYTYNPKTIYLAGAISASKDEYQNLVNHHLKKMLRAKYYSEIKLIYIKTEKTVVFDGLLNYLAIEDKKK